MEICTQDMFSETILLGSKEILEALGSWAVGQILESTSDVVGSIVAGMTLQRCPKWRQRGSTFMPQQYPVLYLSCQGGRCNLG